MPFELSKPILLTNICAMLAATSTFPFIFHFFIIDKAGMAFITLLFFLNFLVTLLFNHKRQYLWAKWWLVFNANGYLFLTAASSGREAGEHLIYLPVILGAVLVFAPEKKSYSLTAVALSLLCLIVLELTDYGLFLLAYSDEELLLHYRGNLVITFGCSIAMAFFILDLYEKQNRRNADTLQLYHDMEGTVNYFSDSLFGANSMNEVLWDVAKNCVSRLGLVDCVIYLLDEERQVLVQKAAYGPKNPEDFAIKDPIELPVGVGIVGAVARSGIAEVVPDTSKDQRYVVDDLHRYSEIAVPLIYQGKVIGVIDSEHPDKNFFTDQHAYALKIIASLCASKVMRARVEEERKRIEDLRAEAERVRVLSETKSRFFANISHEFRTPLTLIMGPLEQKLANPLDEKEDAEVQRSYQHARHLLGLINQLLTFSRLEAGQLKLEVQPVDIPWFMKNVLGSFHSYMVQQQITYVVHYPDDGTTGYIDHDKLEKIMYNLITNAIKFTERGGQVVVTTKLEDDRLHISVEDNGRGIPAHDLPHIFERYYQVPGVSSGQSAGFGIGLSLVRELVTLHCGSINVHSVEGEGAVFEVSVPVAQSFYREDEHAVGREISLAKTEVTMIASLDKPSKVKVKNDKNDKNKPVLLVVEDHDDLRNYICEQLSSEFRLLEASDGKAGEALAIAHTPDLIVCDWMMPLMDGRTLCERLKADMRTSHIPLIMLTAKADDVSRKTGLLAGADAFVVKPFDAEELKIRANKLISQREKLKDHFRRAMMLEPEHIEANNMEDEFLKKACDVVEKYLDDTAFSIEIFQQEMAMSRMHLHRKLKAMTGMSATEFIRTYRLKRSAQLLADGNVPVSQVAYATGFNSLSYFTKSFRKQFKCNPSEYSVTEAKHTTKNTIP